MKTVGGMDGVGWGGREWSVVPRTNPGEGARLSADLGWCVVVLGERGDARVWVPLDRGTGGLATTHPMRA